METATDRLNLTRDFYIPRKARDEFHFPDSFYALRGNIIIPNYQAAQSLAELINGKKRDNRLPHEQFVQPAQLNAMGLLHEIFHLVLATYKEEINKNVYLQCEEFLTSRMGTDSFDALLKKVGYSYPPLPVYLGKQTVEQFLSAETDGIPNKHILLEEIILLNLQHKNPALSPMADLLEDEELFKDTMFNEAIELIEQYFDEQPTFENEQTPLLKLLLASINSSPNSLTAQLAYIQTHWERFTRRIQNKFIFLQAIDFLKEEGKYFLTQTYFAAQNQAVQERAIMPDTAFPFFHGMPGEKESPPVPVYPAKSASAETQAEPEPEQFSADLSWMPRLILIAKNAFVWLDQLSKKYSRPITRLDQIPDEELDKLVSFGITGLWLIGIWKRSDASKRIKHIHGNLDAEASAYSLDAYDISDELGGYTAYLNLRDRAKYRGLRLACDMVPNHMGMDSDWVMNHPDWFLQSEFPPYPNYSFTGPDLSTNDRVGIFLEDGYWRRTDAAVVFKRVDRYTGAVSYLYHGNDGTNMPWNDTAQLNFMKPEVREAVIQTILHVARMFPVIRFDAAMVLAKKHYQRLWFPQPGTAGAVPSRAMFGMTKEQFDAVQPVEFWREVVDRVQQEVPDTLLLAEAFWLMEGYFVRTLGMHRVYNSAFMHMLKKEENTNFKQSIKNVLEYNPGILKRHVNFMSNPDEETAIAQFGSHDKYFGVCVLMITLPGLPMFGHGQIEGFKEKYGMEYRRAYYDEHPDYHLMYRHEQEITPLLKKRYLFAEVENFQLYDCYDGNGILNDNVFAYSNSFGNERALIVYNNAFEPAYITVHPTAAKQMIGEIEVINDLPRALGISRDYRTYYILKDSITRLEFLRSATEFYEEGVNFSLEGYKYHVFLEFIHDTVSPEKPYDILAERLQGKGVFSIAEEIAHVRLEPLHNLIRDLLTETTLSTLHYGRKKKRTSVKALRLLETNFNELLDVSRTFDTKFIVANNNLDSLQKAYAALLEATSSEPVTSKSVFTNEWKELIARQIAPAKSEEHTGWHIIIIWMSLRHINSLRQADSDILNDWKLERVIMQAFNKLSGDYRKQQRDFDLLKLLTAYSSHRNNELTFTARFLSLLHNPLIERTIGINQWQEELYFSKEQFEDLLDWATIVSAVRTMQDTENLSFGESIHSQQTISLKSQVSGVKSEPTGRELELPPKKESMKEKLTSLFEESAEIKQQAEKSGYRFEEFVSGLGKAVLLGQENI